MARKAKVLTITAVVTLSMAGPAVAVVHRGFHGSIGVGHLQIGTSFNAAGKPKSVNRVEWSNVPATCPSPFQISDELRGDRGDRRQARRPSRTGAGHARSAREARRARLICRIARRTFVSGEFPENPVGTQRGRGYGPNS